MKPEEFEVWPDNLPAVDAWLQVATQWRTAPLADGRVHWLGLDYTAAAAGLQLAGRSVAPDAWAGVKVMERGAADALNGVRG